MAKRKEISNRGADGKVSFFDKTVFTKKQLDAAIKDSEKASVILFDEAGEMHCPNCGAGMNSLTSCVGGTDFKPNPNIKWMCVNCLYEW